MRKDEIIYQQLVEDEEKVQKYDTSGIYGIYVNIPIGEGAITRNGNKLYALDSKLLYIGKSKNMLKRIAAHIAAIDYPKEKDGKSHKYEIIRQLKEKYNIQFDVLEYTSTTLLDETEGYYIRKFAPPLNTQIPKPEGGYWINKKAQQITLEEILNYE